VLLSSHVLSEVEAICDRIGVLRDGRLLAVETVAALRARVVRRALVRWPGEPPAGLADLAGVERVERRGHEVTLWVRGDGRALLERLAHEPFEHFVFPEPELEDAFLSFYREARDGGA
jgi:ABC-2 type transport system ATP-binding protein